MNKKGLLIVLIATLAYLNMQAQDLRLWYSQPAKEWVEALPVGNGRIGAMIFGGVDTDRIQFNEETLWSGYPRDYNKKGAYKYLDSIRGLLFSGKQKEAESLAGKEFMGLQSANGDTKAWADQQKAILRMNPSPAEIRYNDQSWKKIRQPNYDGWEREGLGELDGAVWLRKTFEVAKNWTGKELVLDINKIANADLTYVNGTLVGSQENDDARNYKIPAGVVKPGKNVIAILVLNFSGKGGILGYKDHSKHIGIYPVEGNTKDMVSLNGDWLYNIQDDEVPVPGEYQARYQPFGDLLIHTPIDASKVLDYKRTLDLETAAVTTTYNYQGVNFRRTYIASQPDQVFAVNISADKNKAVSFNLELSSPHKKFEIVKSGKNTLALKVKVKAGALEGTALATITTVGGNVLIEKDQLVVKNANAATILLTAATNFKNYKDVSGNPDQLAAAAMNKITAKSFSSLLASHTKEYQQYFNTFSVNFYNNGNRSKNESLPTDKRLAQFASTNNDPGFVSLYMQYGRYLLISSSRPGTNPANLQGIWNDLLSPPWGSKYTTNINAEMNYWPAELLGLSPLHNSFFKMVSEVAQSGKETAKEYYNAPGWVLHHNTDLWRGAAPINASNHGIWVTGGAWFCDHLWERYLFTKDKQFLKDTAYPLMKDAALFFNAFLIKDPATGYLISTPSNSPEQGGLVAGPTMDHQLIRSLFKNTIEASTILNTDAALRNELQNKYKQIAPNKIGRYGQLQEWMQDVDDTTNKHRHVSHLWAVYPGNEINWEATPELMKAARQSLIYRGDAATGWSLGWKINLWARFKDGNHTYKLIQMLLTPAGRSAGSYPNLFDAHPPFQIDGNFGGAAGIGEMLLQSHTKFIDILPALPDALPSGNISGIRARGGLNLTMEWERKELKNLRITAIADGSSILRYKNQELPFSFKKGKRYRVENGFKRIVEE